MTTQPRATAAKRGAGHGPDAIVRPHARRREDDRHRAARVARARRGRGPRRGGRAPRRSATARAARAATCACPASARARCRRRSSSSASAARPCSTRPCAARSAAGTSTRSTPPGIHPVGDPELDLGDLPDRGRAADLLDRDRRAPDGDARRVQGPRGRQARGRRPTRRPSTPSSSALRERLARLETVERAAGEGDFVVIDYVGSLDGEPFEGGEGRDQLIELGSAA